MENKKWTREEAEQNKNKLLEELKELPTSQENLEWVTKELNQLIDEEEIHERAWHDNPIKAIGWNLKLDDPSKVSSPYPMGLNEAKLIKVKKTIIIESYE